VEPADALGTGLVPGVAAALLVGAPVAGAHAAAAVGVAYLLGWREVYPWLALLAWPLLGFYAWRDGGLDLSSPIFLLLTLFTTVSGPLQTLAAWRLAVPEVRRHRRWFVGAAFANLFFYTELKNVINRVAQLKQLRGERRWVVTPRSAGNSGGVDTSIDAPSLEGEEAAA